MDSQTIACECLRCVMPSPCSYTWLNRYNPELASLWVFKLKQCNDSECHIYHSRWDDLDDGLSNLRKATTNDDSFNMAHIVRAEKFLDASYDLRLDYKNLSKSVNDVSEPDDYYLSVSEIDKKIEDQYQKIADLEEYRAESSNFNRLPSLKRFSKSPEEIASDIDALVDLPGKIALQQKFSEEIYLSPDRSQSFSSPDLKPMPGIVKNVAERGCFFLRKGSHVERVVYPVPVSDQERLLPQVLNQLKHLSGRRNKFNVFYSRLVAQLYFLENQNV